ncbi:type VII secretion protein EccE, partial [Streptomyces clavuligerus]|uniref:type VII secretion protein EccE n=1 Tax=Streptomyces clavuligerus TaxID=1901 RepID=UPI0018D13F72
PPAPPLGPVHLQLRQQLPQRGRGRLGAVHDGRAWVCLIAVERGAGRRLPLRGLGGLLRLDGVALESVQLLVHGVTAPGGADAASGLCATAYRQLNTEPLPLLRQTWVALRLGGAPGPGDLASRGCDEPGALRALRRAASAAVTVLERAGFGARVLDAAEATEALAEAAGLPPVPEGPDPEGGPAAPYPWTGHPAPSAACCDGDPGGERIAARAAGPAGVTESRYGVRAAGVRHVTYRLQEPGGAGLTALLELLTELPVRATALAVTLTGPALWTAAVRVTTVADDPGTPGTADAPFPADLVSGGRTWCLERLDGGHAAGLLATLPLGLSTGRPLRCAVPAGPAARAAGVVLGTDRDGRPSPVELLRREPLRLGVLVPHERAALLVFRLLTAGAEVHVRSPHPQVWARLLRTSGADPARLVVGLPGGATPPPGGPLRPVVVVDEFTGSCGAPRPDLGAWQIGISLHHRAPGGARALGRYDAVLAPRLAPPLARQLAEAYGLPADALRTLPLLPGDATALIRAGSLRTLWVRPVPAEKHLTVPARPVSHGA